jgi:hypothetical protein
MSKKIHTCVTLRAAVGGGTLKLRMITTIAAVAIATAFSSEFCTDEDNSVIRSAMDPLKIITLLTVTVPFLFAFFNLILDSPRTYCI